MGVMKRISNLDGFGERHADFEALGHALLRVELQIVVDAVGLVAQPLLARTDCVPSATATTIRECVIA